MKTINKHLTLLAAAMLMAGVASAQGPTNQGTRAVTDPTAPTAPGPANFFAVPNGGSNGYSSNPGSYSQDSYVSQTSTGNSAIVNQSDNRTGDALNSGGGSSASVVQTGTFNNAYQDQTLESATTGKMRNELRTTQAGDHDESRQTQTGGYGNTAQVMQGAGSSLSSAVQTQIGGHFNSASITQSQYNTDPNDKNSATQMQTGQAQSARIAQQGHSGVAMQTQSGYANSADISQGAHGKNNTAIQTQTDVSNKARIVQSSDLPQGNFDRNYAEQTQSGYLNNADINQRSHDSYAEQVQSGAYNASKITQGAVGTPSNANSAAYTTQSGMYNSATVTQR